MDIYTSLKIECAKAGITLKEMCERAGVNRDLLSEWKKKEPKSIITLRKLRAAIKELDKSQTTNVNTELDDVC